MSDNFLEFSTDALQNNLYDRIEDPQMQNKDHQNSIFPIPNPIIKMSFNNTYNPDTFDNTKWFTKEKFSKTPKACEFLYENVPFNFNEIKTEIKSIDFSLYKTNKEFLEQCSEIEKISLSKINLSRKSGMLTKFHKGILKDMTYQCLDDKVREYSNLRNILVIIRQIRNHFFEDIKSDQIDKFQYDNENIKLKSNILKVNEDDDFDVIKSDISPDRKFMKSSMEEEKKNKMNQSMNLLKKYYKKYFNIFLERLENQFNVKNFPHFLVREIQVKLKRKINRLLIPKFRKIFLQEKFFNSVEYSLISKYIPKIARRELSLFSNTILEKDTISTIFDLVILHLYEIFKESTYLSNQSHLFEESIKKYSDIMQVNFAFYLRISSIENYIISLNKHKLIYDLQESLGDDLKLYLFMTLSLILMLNNFNLQARVIEDSSIMSREKECLVRILIALSQNPKLDFCDFKRFGQYLESIIFEQYFYNKKLTDELTSEQSFISKSTIKIDVRNEAFHKIKNKISFDIINTNILNCGNKNIREKYCEVMNQLPHITKNSCCEKFCGFFMDFFLPGIVKKPQMNLRYSKLIPYDNKSKSSQCCLIIHGFVASHQNLYTQWENFIVDFDCYVDFYFYTWDSKSITRVIKDILKFLGALSLTILTRNFLKIFQVYRTYRHANNVFTKTMRVSTYAGKLLAYILASKAFFEHKSITLVGFSLGAQVVKHTLKEMRRIAKYCPFVRNIIHNIVFIGGAARMKKEKWGDIKELVAGRIINIYNGEDKVLNGIFKYVIKKEPIGSEKLLLDPCIENYDFSDLKITHVEYWDYSNIIIKKINLF